jgi:hypothetical protein
MREDFRSPRWVKNNSPSELEKGEHMPFSAQQLVLLAKADQQLTVARNTLSSVQLLNGPCEVARATKDDPDVWQAEQLLLQAGQILFRIVKAEHSDRKESPIR